MRLIHFKETIRKFSLLVLWITFGAVPARSHATLLHTEPIANTRLPVVPSSVRLSFNERVEPVFNSIRVVDQRGKRVDDGASRVVGEGDVVEVGLKPLGDGGYTVLWRINSVDGHQVQGHFGFGVRSAPPDEDTLGRLLAPEREPFWQFYVPIVKWIGLTAMILWLGGISFLLGIFTPALGGARGTDDGRNEFIHAAAQRPFRILWTGAVLFLIAECLALVGQAVTFTDLPLVRALSLSTLDTVLATTSYGQWWAVRNLAALGLLGLCAWKLRSVASIRAERISSRRTGTLLAIGSTVLGSLILLTIPLTGHARAVPQAAPIAVGGDWAHLASTTIWIGGLVHFWAVVLFVGNSGNDKVELLSKLANRFSRVARICVLVLLATGIYNAWLHMPTWLSFVSTDYGRVLLAKLALVIPILLIAAVNWRRVLPALAGFAQHPDAARKWAGRFRKLIQAETVLGTMVLVLVASLTSLPPSATVVVAGPINLSKRNQNLTVGLRLDSNKVGTNQSAVTLQDSGGRTIADARRVTLYLRSLEMDMGLQTIQAQPSPDGAYQARVFLSMAGRWLISVEVSPSRGDTFVTEFEISSRL